MPVSLMANGTINCCRFVKLDPTNSATGGPNSGTAYGYLAIQCAANTDKPIGISQEASNTIPVGPNNDMGVSTVTYQYQEVAAAQGQLVRIYGPGEECLLYAGAACNPGNDLVSDSSGMGVPASQANQPVSQWIGARAIEAASAQYDKIRVMVLAYGTGSGT